MTDALPVVIAGAGPTGLMCALALARRGVPVVVCEAEPSLTHDLRAGIFHPPTLEMMAPYGVTARMHETGLQVRRWQIRSRRGGMVAEFDLGLLADVTPYPYRLHLEQHRLTPIQLEILRKEANAEVHFNHRVTAFEEKERSVLVRFESEGIPGKLEAAFLVGADGGRCSIRLACKRECKRFYLWTAPTRFVTRASTVSTSAWRASGAMAGCCSRATPRTSTIRSAVSASIAASTKLLTSPASSPGGGTAKPRSRCSTFTCDSGAPPPSSRCRRCRSGTSGCWRSAIRRCRKRAWKSSFRSRTTRRARGSICSKVR